MRPLVAITAAALALAGLAPAAPARAEVRAVRVTFAADGSTEYVDRIAAGDRVNYMMMGRAGQPIHVDIVSDTGAALFDVMAGDRVVYLGFDGPIFSGFLPADGVYRISVATFGGIEGETSYRLYVEMGEDTVADAIDPEPAGESGQDVAEAVTPVPAPEAAEDATPQPAEDVAKDVAPVPAKDVAKDAAPTPAPDVAEAATPDPGPEASVPPVVQTEAPGLAAPGVEVAAATPKAPSPAPAAGTASALAHAGDADTPTPAQPAAPVPVAATEVTGPTPPVLTAEEAAEPEPDAPSAPADVPPTPTDAAPDTKVADTASAPPEPADPAPSADQPEPDAGAPSDAEADAAPDAPDATAADSPAPDPGQPDPAGYLVATGLNGDPLNLRARPSTSAPIVAQVYEGAVLESRGCAPAEGRDWCQVVSPLVATTRGHAAAAFLRPATPEDMVRLAESPLPETPEGQ